VPVPGNGAPVVLEPQALEETEWGRPWLPPIDKPWPAAFKSSIARFGLLSVRAAFKMEQT
jgi:hypothetical protein